MKLHKKWGHIALLSLPLLLAGCTSTEEADAPAKTTPKVEQTTKDTKQQEAKAEKKKAEKEAKAQQKQAEIEYATYMESHLQHFVQGMTNFGGLNTDASLNPMLMLDNNWIGDMALALMDMQSSVDDMRATTPPSGELTLIHEEIMRALDDYQVLLDNYPDAVDNIDVNLMEECLGALERGTVHLQKAEEMITTYTNEMGGF